MAGSKLLGRTSFKLDGRSLVWYLTSRVTVITLLLGGASLFYWRGLVGESTAPVLFFMLGLSYAQALLSLLLLKWVQKYDFFAQLQLIWDLLFVTVLILITGGMSSVFSFAYLLVIVSASLLLSRRDTLLAAASAAILFGGLLDLQFFGYLNWLNLTAGQFSGRFLYTVFVHVIAFFLTAILSGTLAERWRVSEAKLQRKQIDYEELAKLNQTILSHMGSGLLVINRKGYIRSINRAASEILGCQLEDVYDRPVDEVLPGIVLFKDGSYNLVSRGEGQFVRNDGNNAILGYGATPINDHKGTDVGLLVTFQDLTKLKEVEADLQRADRLAAVGRLASGMAHEIRNPLASISGSVQLLMEGEKVSQEDKRLMGIVVRETERLSDLLTDFLLFARPKLPSPEEFDISLVLDDLAELLSADARFDNIHIVKNYPKGAKMVLDRAQIRQALWDLALNGAEAMDGTGELVLGMLDNLSLYVEDSGPGVPAPLREQIFDPFFSTKVKGTGLGLATVHSIVESHGGSIVVEDGASGGARFSLKFSPVESK